MDGSPWFPPRKPLLFNRLAPFFLVLIAIFFVYRLLFAAHHTHDAVPQTPFPTPSLVSPDKLNSAYPYPPKSLDGNWKPPSGPPQPPVSLQSPNQMQMIGEAGGGKLWETSDHSKRIFCYTDTYVPSCLQVK